MIASSEDLSEAGSEVAVERPCVSEVPQCELVDEVLPQGGLGRTLDDVEVAHSAHVGQRLPDRSDEHALDLDDLEVVDPAALVVEWAAAPHAVWHGELGLQHGNGVEAEDPCSGSISDDPRVLPEGVLE